MLYNYSDTFFLGIHLLDEPMPWMSKLDYRKLPHAKWTPNMVRVHAEIQPSYAYASGAPDRDLLLGRMSPGNARQKWLHITLLACTDGRHRIYKPSQIKEIALAIGRGVKTNGIAMGYPIWFDWDHPRADANWRSNEKERVATGWLIR